MFTPPIAIVNSPTAIIRGLCMLWLVICHRYITIDSINFGQLKMSFLCFIVHLVCGTNAINEINLLFDLDSSYSIWLKSE